MIYIKTEREIEKMREASKIVIDAHEYAKNLVVPGISTGEIDQKVDEFIRQRGGIPATKGYGGFPGALCLSVNEEVVHGIPGKRIIQEGDIVSVDIVVKYGDYYSDAARTVAAGNISPTAERLIEVTRQSFFEGIKYAKEGFRLFDISHAIQTYVEAQGFSIVRDYVGHGIGKSMHEDPQIPNFGPANRGPRLKKGMVLAIEPMVNEGVFQVRTLEDNWTVVTSDGKLSAHYENTIVITDDEPEILTML